MVLAAETKNNQSPCGCLLLLSCITCTVERADASDVDACPDCVDASYEAQWPCSNTEGSPDENGDTPKPSSSIDQSCKLSLCHAASSHCVELFLCICPKDSRSFCKWQQMLSLFHVQPPMHTRCPSWQEHLYLIIVMRSERLVLLKTQAIWKPESGSGSAVEPTKRMGNIVGTKGYS